MWQTRMHTDISIFPVILKNIYLFGWSALNYGAQLFLASCRTLWRRRDALVVAHGLQSVWAPAAAEQAL